MRISAVRWIVMGLAWWALLSTGSAEQAAKSTDSEPAGEQPPTLEQLKQEMGDVIAVLKAYSADRRDQAIAKTQAALEKLDTRIEALETKLREQWSEMDQAAREQARAALETLRQQRNRVAEWYGGLKHGSADAWAHLQKGFTDAFAALQNAWQKADAELPPDDAGDTSAKQQTPPAE